MLKSEEHTKRHELELESLHRVCEIISRYSSAEVKFPEILKVLEGDLGLERMAVMLLSSDGCELRFAAASELEPVRSDARYGRGEGITGQVLQRGKAAVVPRIGDEPQFQNRVHAGAIDPRAGLSFICMPIVLDSEVIGTLSADLPPQDEEGLKESARLLRIVAGLVANDVKARRIAQIEQERLLAENQRLRDELGQVHRPNNIIGNSDAMRLVYRKISQVAQSDTTVLVRGESGTGKELVASAIHYGSARADKPFVKVNCAALSEGLLESELFGHEKGAFTGAVSERIGRIEQAEGGTLFLDEVGDFSPAVQVKLLRVLQEREFERLGSNETRRADVRVVAATNRDLEAACSEGLFRSDMYYRINVFPICLPVLRDRKDDILLLANHFVESYARAMGKEVHRISTTAITMLTAYHWPGNVRELANCMEYAVLVCTGDAIQGSHLPPTLQLPEPAEGGPTPGTLKQRVSLLEKDMITDALKRTNGKVSAAAEQLGITPRMVRYKIKNLKIPYPKYFRGGSWG